MHPYSVVNLSLRVPARRAAIKRERAPAAAPDAPVAAPDAPAAAPDAAAAAVPPPVTAADLVHLRAAVAEAALCTPSDTAYSVGAVLVDAAGVEIARGRSRELGGREHAEEVALSRAGERARGSTLFSSMEPCGARLSGATPCAARLVQCGVARVVLAVAEPPHFIAQCSGATDLRAAGVRVDVAAYAQLAAAALAPNAHVKGS